MNGINPSKNWSKKKKNRSQNIKFLVTIIITNLLVYLLFSPKNEDISNESPQKINSDYSFIQLPLKTFVPAIKYPQAISIYTPRKKKIIDKAYLHKKLDLLPLDQDQPPFYQIELSSKDLDTIIKYKFDYFVAYPINHHRETNYEITF